MQIETQPFGCRPRFDIVAIPAIHYPGFQAVRPIPGPADQYLRVVALSMERRRLDRGQLHRHLHAGAVGASRRARRDDDLVAGPAVSVALPEGRSPFQVGADGDRSHRLRRATATYLLQAIRMVDRFMGPHVASQCAKSMLIDVSHTGQIPYLPLLTETKHTDSVAERAQGWLQKNMARDITSVGAGAQGGGQ
jgi:hypothetical protein